MLARLIYLTLPDGHIVSLMITAEREQEIELRECACGCGEWFQPRLPHQNLVNESHQKQRGLSRHVVE